MPALATVARGGLIVFIGLVAKEHVLRADLPPADHFISEYARGWSAPIQVVAFLAWAAATAACAAVAARAAAGSGRPIARAIAVVALAAAAIGLVIAAAFPTETVAGELPEGVERTTGGRLHDLGTLAILAGLLVAAVASLRLVPGRRYRAVVFALAAVLVAIVPVLLALAIDAPGIGQRGFILVGCAWQWAFAGAAVRGSPVPSGQSG